MAVPTESYAYIRIVPDTEPGAVLTEVSDEKTIITCKKSALSLMPPLYGIVFQNAGATDEDLKKNPEQFDMIIKDFSSEIVQKAIQFSELYYAHTMADKVKIEWDDSIDVKCFKNKKEEVCKEVREIVSDYVHELIAKMVYEPGKMKDKKDKIRIDWAKINEICEQKVPDRTVANVVAEIQKMLAAIRPSTSSGSAATSESSTTSSAGVVAPEGGEGSSSGSEGTSTGEVKVEEYYLSDDPDYKFVEEFLQTVVDAHLKKVCNAVIDDKFEEFEPIDDDRDVLNAQRVGKLKLFPVPKWLVEFHKSIMPEDVPMNKRLSIVRKLMNFADYFEHQFLDDFVKKTRANYLRGMDDKQIRVADNLKTPEPTLEQKKAILQNVRFVSK